MVGSLCFASEQYKVGNFFSHWPFVGGAGEKFVLTELWVEICHIKQLHGLRDTVYCTMYVHNILCMLYTLCV